MIWGFFLIGSVVVGAPSDGKKEVRGSGEDQAKLTVELSWSVSSREDRGDSGIVPDVTLEVTKGQVLGVIPWPNLRSGDGSDRRAIGPVSKGIWTLGRGREGRVRARIEAPLEASLTVRNGTQAVSIPIASILDGPQRTPGNAPLSVLVERLAWDAVSIDLAAPVTDGIVAPESDIPVSVGFNILWPESIEMVVHVSASLQSARGGEVFGREEKQLTQFANRQQPAVRIANLRAPRAEGSYVLEIRANWEPEKRDGSRLGRLIHRRKMPAAASSVVRRVMITVLDPSAIPVGTEALASIRERRKGDVEVDSIDLTRSRSTRPLASGRSPLAEPGRSAWGVPAQALIEPSRRERLLGWFLRSGADAAKLDPADRTGLAWSAIGLKVANPDRPHRLTLKIRGGEPSTLGVALIEPDSTHPDQSPRLLLDACASGPPILENGPTVAFSWLVWPGSTETVLVLVNRDNETTVRLGTVTLTELEEVPPPPTLREPGTPEVRTLGLYLTGTHALDPFGRGTGPAETVTAARNLVKYLGYCGATAAVVPEELADRSRRRALGGQAEEDSTGPDRLDILRRILERQSYSLWQELSFDGREPLPGLPTPDSAEAARRGLVRLDGQGRAEGPAYHPLHPEVRKAMKRYVVETLTRSRNLSLGASRNVHSVPGVVIRLGPGPTLLGTPDTGVDDATFERFVRETFSAETSLKIPGLGTEDPERFSVRLRYLAGLGRMPWLTWRSRAIAGLYAELSQAAQEAVPGAVLAVVTPGLDAGPAGLEARRVDLAGLAPSQAWRSVGLDLQAWPVGAFSPPIFRGICLSTDALAHDLATSPDLDALVASRPRRGVLLTLDKGTPGRGFDSTLGGLEEGSPRTVASSSTSIQSSIPNGSTVWLSALPLGDGPTADEPLGHALAALDAQWVFLASGAVAGHEERIRQFARVFRALPAWTENPSEASNDSHLLPFGVAIRKNGDATQTFLKITNDSPYPIRLACLLDGPATATVEDIGRGLRLVPSPVIGGRNLVLDLLPFGVTAIRIGAPAVRIVSVTPYPSEVVLASVHARSRELAAQLARLNRGLSGDANDLPNPGFELHPEAVATQDRLMASADPMPPLPGSADRAITPAAARSQVESSPVGWRVESNPNSGAPPGTSPASILIDSENPHSGEGSLRLTAIAGPASIVSDTFTPTLQTGLTICGFFRCGTPDASVRVWIEGESNGQSYIRRSEFNVTSEWQERAVRASDLPPGGLESARVRIELLNPGLLWIDDMHLVSDVASKSARLNSRRALLAALQAYREQRYGDFARLATSHWVRQSGALFTARLARGSDQVPRSARASEAEASALSPDRKLR